MFGGLAVFALVVGPDTSISSMVVTIQSAPAWLLVIVGIAAPIIESLVWTVVFVEGFARAFRAPLWGAACGVFAIAYFSTCPRAYWAYRCQHGLAWYLTSLLSNAATLRLAAFANLVALRWSLVAYALLQIRLLH